MCDAIDLIDLIDLSPSSEGNLTIQTHEASRHIAPNAVPILPSIVPTAAAVQTTMLIPHTQSMFRPLIEYANDNPFDCVQNLAMRPIDAFDMVEKEACLKARRSIAPSTEVKLAKLLSLSDDNLLDDDEGGGGVEKNQLLASEDTGISCSTGGANVSSIYNTAVEHTLDCESPPISMSVKMAPDSGSGSVNNSAETCTSVSSTDGSGGVNIKKPMERRKQLLKLSISNSTFNSPVSRYMASSHRHNAGVEFTESNCLSPISAMLSDATNSSEHLISAESPLKLVDDDLMFEEPPKNLADPEKDFEADLQLLTLPILKRLPSPIAEENSLLMCSPKVEAPSAENVKCIEPKLADLKAIRAKLKVKQEKADSKNDQDVSQLIQNLKSLICDIDAVEDAKKQQAQTLLETLSHALHKNEPSTDKETSSTIEPKPIQRQGTFDLDLEKEKQQEQQGHSDHLPDVSVVTEETSAEAQNSQPRVEEMPDIMLQSSATYDGETADERHERGLQLPEVEPLYACASNTQLATVPQRELQPETLPAQPDLSEIIEQLTKLLEQHQLTQHSLSDSSDDANANTMNNTSVAAVNPTFIVLMNPGAMPAIGTSAANDLTVKKCNAYVTNLLESSFSSNTKDSADNSSLMRRRSQSLSIHDKVRILRLPKPVQTPAHAAATGRVSPNVTPPKDSTANASDFQTPSCKMLRRNSFSCATPYTPIRNKHNGAAHSGSQTISRPTANVVRPVNVNGAEPHAIVHPMPFKPDLKKRTKTSMNSILKSTAPMKATIPIKKVAPMLKPDYKLGHAPSSSTLNASVRGTSAKAARISCTSTPMVAGTTSRGTVGLPNACSTPNVFSTPLKPGGVAGKPRIIATPNVKLPMVDPGTLRRRTIAEFKVKSPLKSRASSVGVTVTNAAGVNNPDTNRKTVRHIPYTARTPSKGMSRNSLASTSVMRTSITRQSGFRNNEIGVIKNKENKQP